MTVQSKSGQTKTGRKTPIQKRAAEASAFAGEKIKSSRASARKAGRKAAESVDAFPVAALLGGLAIGAVVGALLPKTRQEEELLGSLGGALNDRAMDAVSAARDAGQAKLDELGISKDAAGKQVGKLIESLATVAESAGNAAVDAVKP